MTLTEFLLARIAEDEEVAKSAEPGRWKLWGMTVMADPKGTSNVDDAIEVAHPRTPSTTDRLLHTGNAQHIARHDPARVLAECEAKRLIVQACTTPMPRYGQLPEDYERVPTDREDVLRILAAMYADHPDYREEWKP